MTLLDGQRVLRRTLPQASSLESDAQNVRHIWRCRDAAEFAGQAALSAMLKNTDRAV